MRDSEAQLRLQKLEEMVTSLMRIIKEDSESRRDKMSLQVGNSNQHLDNPSTTGSDLSPDLQLNTNISEREYISTTHWTAILENVCVPSRGTVPTYS